MQDIQRNLSNSSNHISFTMSGMSSLNPIELVTALDIFIPDKSTVRYLNIGIEFDSGAYSTPESDYFYNFSAYNNTN